MAKEKGVKTEGAVESPKETLSAERQNLLKVIEIYKTQNPKKYELKKEELGRKLASVK